MKKDKNGMYFKYALGEIILVVIGILIALQINNLNENAKNKEFEKEMLTQIQLNLKKDKLTLEKILISFDNAVTSSDKILNSELSEKPEDSIKIWLGAIIQFDRFQPLTNAYEVLNSNGLDKISNKELRFLLGTYYDDEASLMIKAINDVELAFNQHWTPILVEEIVEFEFKRSVELKDYSILLNPSKVYNIIKLNRNNFGGGIHIITRGIRTIEKIQNLIKKEI
ncbi:MAG: hypothetical protein KC469_01225 [Flavobacteriaceae bacterium]|nr:hypothetical protein [Flavobacteriaceae bacterium]